MNNRLKPGSITVGLGLMLTTLCQAQQGNLQGVAPATPLSFKVPPHALSAISFSAAPNAQCSVAPANGSGSGQAFTVYTNDEGTATFYVTPSEESSSAAQLVATCSSGNQQTIEIQPVAGAKPLVAPAPSNAATNARLGHTVRPALTGDPMALSNQELVKAKYPLRPDLDIPVAMRLKASIEETMMILETGTDEIAVKRAQKMRNNAGPGERPFFDEWNDLMAKGPDTPQFTEEFNRLVD